jgi:hypothetical protein
MRKVSFSARPIFLLFVLVGVLTGGVFYKTFEARIVAALSSVTLNNGIPALSGDLDLESQTSDLGSDIGAYHWSVDPDGVGVQSEQNLMVLNVPFNSGGTQTDFSGESHNGTVNQAIIPADPGTVCKVGTCLDFDASNDYVSISGTFGGTSEATVSAWVKVEANTGNFQSVLSPNNQTFIHLQLNYPNGDGNLAIYTNATTILLPMINVPLGEWHHVAISAQSGSTKAYVDGTEVSSDANTFSTILSTTSLSIGRGFAGGRFFNGMIDEVQVYPRALTSQQISRLYSDGNAGFGAPTLIESEETVQGEVWDLAITPVTTAGSIGSPVPSGNSVTIALPPDVAVLQPNGSESIQFGTSYDIQWEARGNNVLIDTIDLSFTLNDSTYSAIPGATGLSNGTLYTPELTFGGTAFADEDGKFFNPTGVAVDGSGNVYVVDQGTYRVQKFDNAGNYITKWGSFGSGNGQFSALYGIAVDGSGNVYVADAINHRIQKFTDTGTYLTQWGTNGSGNGQFNVPYGVGLDGSGNVYVADYGNNRIQKFSNTGTYLTQWGTNGSGDGQFTGPYSVTADVAGDVYVADTGNNRIQKFSNTGTFLAKWGTSGTGNGQLSSPRGVAVDAVGGVYVADAFNDRIQKFDSSGTYITQMAIPGTTQVRAHGVALDGSGNVFASNRTHHLVQKYMPGGTFSWTVSQGNTSQAKIRATATDDDLVSGQDTSDATFTLFGSSGISGTCRQSDNSTNCADGATVKVAIDGVLAGGVGTTSSGIWSVAVATLSAGDVVTVFVDGVAEANEAVAVTKYDGAGEITGVELIESHLTIGSDDNETITNADLALYDNSVSADEDIFFEVDANNDFTVDFEGGHDAKLLIFVGNTYRPDSSGSGNVSTNDLQNDGTLIADGNTIFVSGDWVNTGTFTANTSTVDFSSTGTQTLISGSSSFATVTHSGSGTLQLSGALTVTSAFDNDDGIFYLNGFDWTMTGATFSNDGTLQIQGGETITGLVQDLGAGTALLSGDGPAGTSTFILEDAYFNLTIDADASETFEQSDDTVISNTLTITSGTYSQNGFATEVNGANTLIVDGGTYEQGGDPLTVVGDLQVLNGGIFNGSETGAAIDINGDVDLQVTADTVRLTSGTMTVAGDWTNAMATGFDHNEGTVQFDTSAAAAINGSTVWYNVTINEPATGKTLTFEAGEVQTFETGGTLSATGDVGNLITFVSSDPGVTQWEITHEDENSGNLNYVSVTDGACTASSDLSLIDSTDGGNNGECWLFLSPDVPDAIDTLTAVGIDEAAILSWEAPAENDSAITDYIVEFGLTSGFPGNAQVFNDGVSDVTGATVTGLTNDVEYTFRVATVNGEGTGPYSNEDTAIPGISPIYPDVSTYLGGNGAEHAAGIGLDTSGNMVLSGVTSSTDFPISNELQTTVDDYDIYVTVLSPGGTSLVSSTYFGGDGYDEAFALHTDAFGNIYVAAMTDSTDLFSGARAPTLSGYDVTAPVGNFDTVILKFNEDVSDVLFGTYLGGSEEEAYMRRTMKADDGGMVYVVGHTYSNDFPLTANAFDTTRDDVDPESYEGFVAKIDTNEPGVNSLVYSSYIGGANSDDPLGVNFDSDGNIYVVGETYSADFSGITSGAFEETIDDVNGDGFLVKIDPTGTNVTSLIYGTILGASNDYDAARAVVVNSVTDVVSVCGMTYSSDLSTTTGAYDETYNADADFFIYQMSLDGAGTDDLLYGTFAGGAGAEECGDIHVDSTTGTLAFSGISTGDFPTTLDAFQTDAAGNYDLLMGRFNPVSGGSDDLLFATYFGGTEEELDWGSYLDESNDVLYFAGETLSGDFPVNASAYQTDYSGGGYDAVVMNMFMPNISDAVNDLSATPGDEEVDLTWTAPDDNGTAITDYIVEYGATSGFPGNAQVFGDGVSASTGTTVTGLVNGTEYSFRVLTVNAVGTSAYSNVDTATPSTLPMILNGDVNDEVTEDTDVISSFVGSPPATSTVGYQWLVDPDGVGGVAEETFMGVNIPMNSEATQIDISGNDVDMSLEGASPSFETADCQVGVCMEFNGADGGLIPTPSVSTITDTFTIEFWAKPTGTRDATPEQNNIAIVGNTGQRYAVFPPQMGAVDAGVGVSVGTNGVSVFEHGDFHIPSLLVYDTVISDWTHVVVTYDLKRPKLYLNGVLVRTGIKSLRANIYPGIELGGTVVGLPFDQHLYGPYLGMLDEFKLYPRVITPQQILQNYNDGFAGDGGPTRILTQEHSVDEVWTLNVFEVQNNGSLTDAAISVDTVTIVPAPTETYVTVETPDAVRVAGNVTVEYTCRNTESIPRDMLVEYYDSALTTWFPATVDSATFDVDATPISGEVSENRILAAPCSSTLPDGSSHSFDWDAVADGVGDLGGETVQIRITADTAQVGSSVLTATTGTFTVGGAFGRVYNDAGVTPIMDGGVNCPSPCTVSVSVNGGAATSASLDVNSEFSFPTLSYGDGDVLTFYLNDETADAVTVVKATGDGIEGLDLWRDRLILRQEGDVEITNSVLDIANNVADADITAIYSMSGTTVLNPSGKTLVIRAGTEYRPGALVTLTGGIDIDGTFTMEANTITVAQGWDAAGGTTTSTGTVTFNGSTTTINPNGQTFNNVTFGFTGTKTLAGDFIVNGDLSYGTFLNGAMVIPDGTPRTITLFGNFSTGGGSFNGIFGSTNLTLRMEGEDAQTMSRASNKGVVFNLIIDKASNGVTLTSAFSMNAGSTFELIAGTFNAGAFSFVVPGSFTVHDGTVSANAVANIAASSTFTQTGGTIDMITFNGGAASLSQTGGVLTDVIFGNGGIKTLTSDFIINGNLTYSPQLNGSNIVADGTPRSIDLFGNFSTNFGFNATFGNANLTLNMVGTNAQTMLKFNNHGFSANLIINKPSNSVTLISNLSLGASTPFTMNSGIFNAAGFTLTVPGVFTVNGGTVSANAVANIESSSTFTQTGGIIDKITFVGTNATLTQSDGTITDVTFANNGPKTFASDFTIDGNLHYAPSLAPALIQGDATPRMIHLMGNFSTGSGFNGIFGNDTLTISMTGTNAQTLSKGGNPILSAHLEIDKPSSSVTLISAFPMGGTGSFTMTSGTFDTAEFTITVPGEVAVTGGTISAGTAGTLSASGAFDQTGGDIESVTFTGNAGVLTHSGGSLTNVTFANSGTKTIASDFIIAGDLIYAPGVHGASVFTDGVPHVIAVSGSFSTSGSRNASFGDSNLTLRMTGTNAQTMSHANPLFSSHLEIDKPSNAVALSSAFTFPSGRNFTITDGTFDVNGNSWNMSGVTFSNNGTVQLRGSETITGLTQDIDSGNWRYVGDGAAGTVTFTVKDFGTTDYYDVSFAGHATETLQQGAATVIANTLQVTSGTYSQNAFTTNVNGTNTLIVDGGTYEQGGAALTVEGDFQVLNNGIFNGSNTGAAIDVNGSVDLQSTANTVRLTTGTMTVEGDWTNDMTTGFDNNNGTVRLDTSSAAAVNGSTIWYNLVVEPAGKTVTFEAGELQTFETGGDLSATGASGNLINFVSSDPGVTQWDITHMDENSGNLSYVSVTDGGCISSSYLILTDSVDGGNNDSCWFFGVQAVPDAVDDLDAAAGDGEVVLTWTAPASNGSDITDYIVEYGETLGFPGNAQVFIEGTSAITGATVIGLTNDTEYSFRVKAVNGLGESAYSNVDTATPNVPAPPDAIINLVATGSNGQVTLTWSAPDDNGWVITDYIVEYGITTGFPGNAQIYADGTSSLTGATVIGLTNGTEYSFRVKAVNANGESAYSNVDTATPAAGSAPENTTDTEVIVDIDDFLSFSIANLAVGNEPEGDQPFGAGDQITDLTSTTTNDYAISGSFGSPVYTMLEASTNSNDGYSVIAYAANLDGRTNTLLRSGGAAGNAADEIVDSLARLPAAQASNAALVLASATGIAFRLMDANTDISLRESDEDTQWGDGDAGTALWASFPLGSGAAQVIYDTANFSGVPTIAFINWFVGIASQQQSGSYAGQVTFAASVN